MITSIQTIRTTLLAGDHTIGVAHQLYDVATNDARTRVAGQITASRLRVGPHGYTAEHVTLAESERDAAIAWHRAGAPEPQPGTEEHPTLLWRSGDGRFTITEYRL